MHIGRPYDLLHLGQVLATRTSVTRFRDPVMGELVSFPYGVKYGGLQIPNGALDNEIMNLALRLD